MLGVIGGHSGRVVVVSGGASGIGRAIAEAFRDAGARVGVIDVNPAVPEGTVALVADVTDDGAISAVVDEFGSGYGRIDVVVADAGISVPATVADHDLAVWTHTYDVNVLGMVRVVRAALPWLRRGSAPSITLMG